MELTIESSPELICVALSGRMDSAGVDKAEARFFASFASRGVDTLFDLTHVTLLTSIGLRVLISGAKTVHARGARVALVAPPGPIREVLEDAALHELMAIADDRTAAAAKLRDADRRKS